MHNGPILSSADKDARHWEVAALNMHISFVNLYREKKKEEFKALRPPNTRQMSLSSIAALLLQQGQLIQQPCSSTAPINLPHRNRFHLFLPFNNQNQMPNNNR